MQPTLRPSSHSSRTSMATAALIEKHSYARYLADDIHASRLQHFRIFTRRRMRQKNNRVSLLAAPAAQIPIVRFEKVDRPVELVDPSVGLNLAPGFVDDDERPWLQDRIHEPVVQSDETVTALTRAETREKQQRQGPPTLDGAADVRGAAQIDAGIE